MNVQTNFLCPATLFSKGQAPDRLLGNTIRSAPNAQITAKKRAECKVLAFAQVSEAIKAMTARQCGLGSGISRHLTAAPARRSCSVTQRQIFLGTRTIAPKSHVREAFPSQAAKATAFTEGQVGKSLTDNGAWTGRNEWYRLHPQADLIGNLNLLFKCLLCLREL